MGNGAIDDLPETLDHLHFMQADLLVIADGEREVSDFGLERILQKLESSGTNIQCWYVPPSFSSLNALIEDMRTVGPQAVIAFGNARTIDAAKYIMLKYSLESGTQPEWISVPTSPDADSVSSPFIFLDYDGKGEKFLGKISTPVAIIGDTAILARAPERQGWICMFLGPEERVEDRHALRQGHAKGGHPWGRASLRIVPVDAEEDRGMDLRRSPHDDGNRFPLLREPLEVHERGSSPHGGQDHRPQPPAYHRDPDGEDAQGDAALPAAPRPYVKEEVPQPEEAMVRRRDEEDAEDRRGSHGAIPVHDAVVREGVLVARHAEEGVLRDVDSEGHEDREYHPVVDEAEARLTHVTAPRGSRCPRGRPGRS